MSINGRGENVGNAYITHIGEQVVRLSLYYITPCIPNDKQGQPGCPRVVLVHCSQERTNCCCVIIKDSSSFLSTLPLFHNASALMCIPWKPQPINILFAGRNHSLREENKLSSRRESTTFAKVVKCEAVLCNRGRILILHIFPCDIYRTILYG